MTFSSQTAPLHVIPVGAVAGLAWASGPPGASDLTVVGKIVFVLDASGVARSVTPEQPGWHLGNPAPEEVDPRGGRRVVVRGDRAFPGHLSVRRGDVEVLELIITPGIDQLLQEAPRSGQATSTSDFGDCLIVSGCDDPHSRRWCNVPSVGLVASWSGGEPMALLCRVCAVCVMSSTVALVFRGTKHITTPTPQAVQVSIVPMHDDTRSATVPGASTKPMITAELDHHQLALRRALPFSRAGSAPGPAVAPTPLVARVSTGTAEVATPTDQSAIRRALGSGPTPFPTESTQDQTADAGPHDVREGPVLPFASAAFPPPPPPPRAVMSPAAVRPSLAGPSVLGTPPKPPPAPPVPIAPDPPPPPRVPPAVIANEAPPPIAQPAEAPPAAVNEAAPIEAAPSPGVRAELERRLKDGASLTGLDLQGASLAGIILRSAKLGGIDFSRADLTSADLTGADLTAAKLEQTRLDGAKLDGAILTRAKLDRASFRGASMRQAQARECEGSAVDLEDADLEGADVRRAKLAGAKMARAKALAINGQEIDLTGADLSNARFERSSLRNAVLRGATLHRSRFSNADLRDADLREAEPDSALQGAKLAGARR